MSRRAFFAAGLLWASLLAPVQAAELVVLVDGSTELPWARLESGVVVAGLHFDLGLALALRLGREARFVASPRKRMGATLAQGQADIACAMMPGWFPGSFDWSRPFLPDAELVLSLQSASRPLKLSDLARQPIGTVSGFVYPEFEHALGPGFVREDAPNASANLRKLSAGRMQHATTNLLFAAYQRRLGALSAPLHPYLVLGSYETQCALSQRSSLTLAELNRAIAALVSSGELQRLMASYR